MVSSNNMTIVSIISSWSITGPIPLQKASLRGRQIISTNCKEGPRPQIGLSKVRLKQASSNIVILCSSNLLSFRSYSIYSLPFSTWSIFVVTFFSINSHQSVLVSLVIVVENREIAITNVTTIYNDFVSIIVR